MGKTNKKLKPETVAYQLPKVEIAVEKTTKEVKEVVKVVYRAERRRLPDDRQALTHKFSIAGHDGYVTVGLYEDGRPGELFIKMAKTGSTINGLLDAFAIMTSMSLQYGVPVEAVVQKLSHTRYEPAGFTKNPNIRVAKSITDYIARWLATKFLAIEVQQMLGITDTQNVSSEQLALQTESIANDSITENGGQTSRIDENNASACSECGSMTYWAGTYYLCHNCGNTRGLQS